MRALSRSPWAGATGTRAVAASLSRVRRTPLLLLYGGADEYCPGPDVRRLAAAVPAARLERFDAGHMDGFLLRRDAYAGALLGHWGLAPTEVPV